MLGWMLKRGSDDAQDVANVEGEDARQHDTTVMEATNIVYEGDTTQIDQPDTPAPVFAARAFKSALFGTPAARPTARPSTRSQPSRLSNKADDVSRTPPSKPQGILLTPGTGTSRPKRVSFGREIGHKKSGAPATTATQSNNGSENNQKKKGVEPEKRNPTSNIINVSDDEWEEEDDPDNYCNHDITVDLNEPHSESGKYWKEQYEEYQSNAKDELAKMLNYKQRAKSYARLKDGEAIDLAEKLKEEQEKVIRMEKRIAESTSKIILQSEDVTKDASPELIKKLTKQTALAIQYKHRVQNLEGELEDLLESRVGGAEVKGHRKLPATSPRTQKTLLETQRELRKARNQTKELDLLREQMSELKDQLRAAEKRAAKAEGVPNEGVENTRAKDLRAQLRLVQEESKKKDEKILQLKKDFEEFRQERHNHEQDTKAVLERAHGKIADLKKEIKSLKHPQSGNAEYAEKTAELVRESPVKVYVRRGGLETSKSVSETGIRRTSAERERLDNIREKFRHDAAGLSEPAKSATMSGALVDRPTLEKPRWQPFVPRSPRDRAYLGEDVANKIQNGGVTPTAQRPTVFPAPDLPSLARSLSRSDRSPLRAEAKVDLLSDRFVKLGGPDFNTHTQGAVEHKVVEKTTKSKLPSERRAAALARIEQGRVEKKLQRQKVMDKENVQPF